MKKTNENIIVQLATPERKFVKVYHDFLQSQLLTTEEKMIFIVLKSFLDFSKDSNGTQGNAYPTIETICRLASMSKPRAIKVINKLIVKKIVKKIRRGLTKSNVYILSDYAAMWACDNVEDMEAVADNQGTEPLTAAEHIAESERMGCTVQIKEKELETLSSDQRNNESSTYIIKFNQSNITTNSESSQDLERYTSDQIKQLFDYDILLSDHPDRQQDIDTVMGVLHTVMNTGKPAVRISGEDKPAMTVIGKLMKLDKESIMYAIDRFSEQTDRIKNPAAYLLTVLYNAPEQYYLDKKNQKRNEMAEEDHSQEGKADSENRDSKNRFSSFKQRTYDYGELERNLLNQAQRCDASQPENES